MNRTADRYMFEYIMNDAKTGFSSIASLQKIQKKVEREIKNGNRKNMFRHLTDAVGSMNDFAENLSRFSVYITSRENGRSVERSVSDAKEVTVNFNRHGAGYVSRQGDSALLKAVLGASNVIRPAYLFVNAGIQALSNFSKVAVKHPWKMAAMVSAYSTTGSILMPLWALALGGDDEYWRLSDWDRQNNLCIYTGKGFIKIPLPHELRVFYALGDNITQAVLGKKTVEDAFLDSALGFTDLIPTSPFGSTASVIKDLIHKGGSEAARTALAVYAPDAFKPFTQLAANRDFKGAPIVNPRAEHSLPGYRKIRTNKKGEAYVPGFLADLARLSDHAAGGDGVEKGATPFSFNPDVVQHMAEGYLGGLYTLFSQGADMIYKGIDPEERVGFRDTPLRRFYISSDDIAPLGPGMESGYRHIQDEVSGNDNLMKRYRDDANGLMKERRRLEREAKEGGTDIAELARKQTELNRQIDEYEEKFNRLGTERHYELRARISEIRKMEAWLDELKGQEQKELEIEIAGLKKEVVEMYGRKEE
jgi:hypothetical protein